MPSPEHDRDSHLVAQVEQLPLAEKVRLLQLLATAIAQHIDAPPHGARAMTSAPSPAVIGLEELTYKIIGCAMAVHRRQSPALREDTYQRDLEVHLAQAGLLFTPQKALEVFDSAQGGKLIGYYIPDFVVADRVVVEIKALGRLDDSHVAQVIGYLAVTGCPVGLLIDFAGRSLHWRRILPPEKVTAHTVNRQWLFVPDWLRAASETG